MDKHSKSVEIKALRQALTRIMNAPDLTAAVATAKRARSTSDAHQQARKAA